jgi:hypothetical protein
MSTYLIDQYQTLHSNGRYGATSVNRAPYILPHIQSLKPKTVLDFGCGQSRLFEKIEALGSTVTRYDPAIPEISTPPTGSFDLVLNIDVMEHLPEDEIDPTLSRIAAHSDHALFIIDTIPAKTTLPDGQNAHLTVKPPEWWQRKLADHFPVVEPIFCHPKWRAAFRTWKIAPMERPALRVKTLFYQIQKSLMRHDR